MNITSAALAARQRRQHGALLAANSLPAAPCRHARAPARCRGTSPARRATRRAAAGRLQQQPPPEARLAGGEPSAAARAIPAPTPARKRARHPSGSNSTVSARRGGSLMPALARVLRIITWPEQPPQFLRLARLARDASGSMNRARNSLRRGQLAGLEQRDEVVNLLQRVLHRRGGQQQQELPRQHVDRLPGLRRLGCAGSAPRPRSACPNATARACARLAACLSVWMTAINAGLSCQKLAASLRGKPVGWSSPWRC